MKKRKVAKKKPKKKDVAPGKGIHTKHGDTYPHIPYVFMIVLMRAGVRKLFIGSCTHGHPVLYSNGLMISHSNPNHFIDGDHNGESTIVDGHISEGWYIVERDVLGKFEGTEEGIKQCIKFEKKLKRKHNVDKSPDFLNVDKQSKAEIKEKSWDSINNPSWSELDDIYGPVDGNDW